VPMSRSRCRVGMRLLSGRAKDDMPMLWTIALRPNIWTPVELRVESCHGHGGRIANVLIPRTANGRQRHEMSLDSLAPRVEPMPIPGCCPSQHASRRLCALPDGELVPLSPVLPSQHRWPHYGVRLRMMRVHRQVGYVVAVVVLTAAAIWASLVASIETCPSCPTDPCPCDTDYRLGLRALILGAGIVIALLGVLATRRSAASGP
jgi:hypothetical protein